MRDLPTAGPDLAWPRELVLSLGRLRGSSLGKASRPACAPKARINSAGCPKATAFLTSVNVGGGRMVFTVPQGSKNERH